MQPDRSSSLLSWQALINLGLFAALLAIDVPLIVELTSTAIQTEYNTRRILILENLVARLKLRETRGGRDAD